MVPQDPNLNYEKHRNVRLPKAQKCYGNGDIILGVMPDNTGTVHQYFNNSNHSPKDVSKLWDKNSLLITVKGEHVKFRPLNTAKLIHSICHVDILMLAYHLLKPKPDNVTSNFTKKNLNYIDLNWIIHTSKLL